MKLYFLMASLTVQKIMISLYGKSRCPSHIASEWKIKKNNITPFLKQLEKDSRVNHKREGIHKWFYLTNEGKDFYKFLIDHQNGFSDWIKDYNKRMKCKGDSND